MRIKLILLVAIALLFAGCAKKAPTFSVAQTWTEKPKKLTIVFTEPIVENQDDLQDDIEEYANNFGEWFKLELKKDYEMYIKDAIALDYQKVNAEGMIIETDHVDSTEFKTPKQHPWNRAKAIIWQFPTLSLAAKKKLTEITPTIPQARHLAQT